MNLYTRYIRITMPKGKKVIAAAIAQALDPDTGGELSFEKGAGGTLTCDTLCTEETYQALQGFIANPSTLLPWVTATYTARFPKKAKPNSTQCANFMASVTVEDLWAPTEPVL